MTAEASSLPPLRPTAAVWLDGLREFVGEQRRRQPPAASLARLRPPPTADELLLEQDLIATHLRHWLGNLPQLFADTPRLNSDLPAVVITTSPAGLVAETILQAEPALAAIWPACCCVTEFEYRFWCRQQPDADYSLHVNHWAWAKTRVPAARAAEFAAFPLADGERYWLFRHGLAGWGPADHHSCQLYRSDGRSLSLLEPAFREGVAGL
jgi:hypothetical protein